MPPKPKPKHKPFLVGTYRTTPFHDNPPPPAVFPKNPKYADVQSKVAIYIQTNSSSNK